MGKAELTVLPEQKLKENPNAVGCHCKPFMSNMWGGGTWSACSAAPAPLKQPVPNLWNNEISWRNWLFAYGMLFCQSLQRLLEDERKIFKRKTALRLKPKHALFLNIKFWTFFPKHFKTFFASLIFETTPLLKYR